MHQAERLAEALGALDLGGHGLLEAAAVEQAGELVGHRLALDRLVQADVLDRHRRLLGEVVEELALGRRERRGRARATETTPDDARVAVVAAAHRMRQRGDVVDGRLARLARLEHPGLGRARRPPRARRRSPVSATCSSGAAALGRTDARPASAPTPSTAVLTTISSSPSRSRLAANVSPMRRIASCSRARSWLSSSRRSSSWRDILLNSSPSAANSSWPWSAPRP